MGEAALLQELAIVFAAALLVVVLLSRLRLPTIAGFILAGALLGPGGLRWVGDTETVQHLAHVGVVLLLFTIGLEFPLRELRRIGRVAALGGTLQIGLTTAAVAGLGTLAGLDPGRGVFYGFLAAVSSTAIVLRGLGEGGETDAPHGKLIVGVLLFQDLCVVPMMLVVPMLAGQGGGAWAIPVALGQAAAVVAGTLLLGGLVVPRLMGVVARTQRRDLFVLAVVVMCVGIGWLTSLAGVSTALGAFLAGVVLAGSEYSHQALSDVLPLRDIFTSLFFISVGLLLDLPGMWQQPLQLLGVVAALILGKALLATLAGLAMRFPLAVALRAGLGLAQVGEFSFVLAEVGARFGLMDGAGARLFLASSALTMLVTPFALRLGPRVAAGAARLRALDRLLGLRDEALESAPPSLAGHVVVLGYGVGGEMLAESLRAAGRSYAVVDVNAARIRTARGRGEPAWYGDVTSPEILHRVRVPQARQVAVLLNDPDSTLRAVRAARQCASGAHIVARARYVADVPKLIAAGASDVVAQEFEASLEVIAQVLRGAQLGDEALGAGLAAAQSRAPGGRIGLPRPLAALHIESFVVGPQAWIVGRSLGQSKLRTRTGASIVGRSRAGATLVHPAAEDLFDAGDVLYLVGDGEALQTALGLLERGPATDEGGEPGAGRETIA